MKKVLVLHLLLSLFFAWFLRFRTGWPTTVVHFEKASLTSTLLVQCEPGMQSLVGGSRVLHGGGVGVAHCVGLLQGLSWSCHWGDVTTVTGWMTSILKLLSNWAVQRQVIGHPVRPRHSETSVLKEIIFFSSSPSYRSSQKKNVSSTRAETRYFFFIIINEHICLTFTNYRDWALILDQENSFLKSGVRCVWLSCPWTCMSSFCMQVGYSSCHCCHAST